MPHKSIEIVLASVRERYGFDAVTLYGSSPDEEYGTCFKIRGISATFSILIQEGALEADEYDIQVESAPPGDYIFAEVVPLDRLMQVISLISGPEAGWPSQAEGTRS